ncbi:MAG: hypothetical protein M0P00_05480, partial [Bacteroidaceae bacterium]|nr:hypothetical protein [Bacteroidaceae bacterium]
VGRGNYFLYYGYFTAILSVVLYLLIVLTRNNMWSWGWLLMFVFQFLVSYKKRQHKSMVVTYTDKAIKQVWLAFGFMFSLTFIVLAVLGQIYGRYDFALMMPLSLLYAGLGTSINGIIIRERWMIFSPLVAFVVAFYMLMMLTIGQPMILEWYLYLGFSFVVMQIIPGHILNRKAKRQC